MTMNLTNPIRQKKEMLCYLNPLPPAMKKTLRDAFSGPFILAGGFDATSAEKALNRKQADLIAFGRPFLANPDLIKRMQVNAALNALDLPTFYTPDSKGYTDCSARGA
jgi:N-ethylmaleimide reductase